jgi:hypothetical protein
VEVLPAAFVDDDEPAETVTVRVYHSAKAYASAVVEMTKTVARVVVEMPPMVRATRTGRSVTGGRARRSRSTSKSFSGDDPSSSDGEPPHQLAAAGGRVDVTVAVGSRDPHDQEPDLVLLMRTV